jgi:hypothetical protein
VQAVLLLSFLFPQDLVFLSLHFSFSMSSLVIGLALNEEHGSSNHEFDGSGDYRVGQWGADSSMPRHAHYSTHPISYPDDQYEERPKPVFDEHVAFPSSVCENVGRSQPTEKSASKR